MHNPNTAKMSTVVNQMNSSTNCESRVHFYHHRHVDIIELRTIFLGCNHFISHKNIRKFINATFE